MKQLLLIGTALLSIAPYASAMNSDQKDSKINSASEKKAPAFSNSITSPSINNNNAPLPLVNESRPQGKKLLTKQNFDCIQLLRSDTADEIVTLQWKNLTETLANIDILKNEFETQFKAFQQIYKSQELDPKPLNEAIKDLFLKLKKQEKLKSQAQLNEIWDKLKQQFLQKLALFIDSNLIYEPINKDTAVENFRFLFTFTLTSHLQDHTREIFYPLARYAFSIFLEEKVKDKSQNLSGYDVFPWEEFKKHFCEGGIDSMYDDASYIISPYLKRVLSQPIAKHILSALIVQTSVLSTVNPVLFKEDVIRKLIQSLQETNLLHLLLNYSLKSSRPQIECLLDKIRNLKELVDDNIDFDKSKKYAEEPVPYETQLKILQERYKFIMDTIIKFASNDVKAKAIITDILNNPDYSFRSSNDIITCLKTAYKSKKEQQEVLNEIIKQITDKNTDILEQKNSTIEEMKKKQQELNQIEQKLNQICTAETRLNTLKEILQTQLP